VFWSICLFKKEKKEILDSEVAKQYDIGGLCPIIRVLMFIFLMEWKRCHLKENINMLSNDCTYLITQGPCTQNKTFPKLLQQVKAMFPKTFFVIIVIKPSGSSARYVLPLLWANEGKFHSPDPNVLKIFLAFIIAK
jgi:hypothetical protein